MQLIFPFKPVSEVKNSLANQADTSAISTERFETDCYQGERLGKGLTCATFVQRHTQTMWRKDTIFHHNPSV